MEIQRGFRDKLDKYAASSQEMTVVMKTEGSAVYDYTCFGVDANDKLSDDRYMVFYNQLSSPQREISFREQNGQACFTLQLSRLPLSVNKLVFTVSIDGAGSMGQIRTHSLSILQNGREVIGLSLTGNDFRDEKAIISVEIYRKDVWRIAAVARGFNGGLGDLLRAYGGEEAEDDASPVGSAPSAQSLPAQPQTPTNANPIMSQTPTNTNPIMSQTPTNANPVMSQTPTNANPMMSQTPTNANPMMSQTPTNANPIMSQTPTNANPMMSQTPTNTNPIMSQTPTNTNPMMSQTPTNANPIMSQTPTNTNPIMSQTPTNANPMTQQSSVSRQPAQRKVSSYPIPSASSSPYSLPTAAVPRDPSYPVPSASSSPYSLPTAAVPQNTSYPLPSAAQSSTGYSMPPSVSRNQGAGASYPLPQASMNSAYPVPPQVGKTHTS